MSTNCLSTQKSRSTLLLLLITSDNGYVLASGNAHAFVTDVLLWTRTGAYSRRTLVYMTNPVTLNPISPWQIMRSERNDAYSQSRIHGTSITLGMRYCVREKYIVLGGIVMLLGRVTTREQWNPSRVLSNVMIRVVYR